MPTTRWLAVAVVFGAFAAAPAAAAPHKVLVLPLDGNADAATRTRLTAHVVRLAKGLDGQVGTAEATFADTALAVGCDPRAPRCSDEVIATLGVDELVWGTASKDGTQTRLVVRRAARGIATREVSTTIAAGEAGDRIDARLAPVFSAVAAAPSPAAPSGAPAAAASAPSSSAAAFSGEVSSAVAPSAVASSAAASPATPGPAEPAPMPFMPPLAEDHRDRNLGIGLVAGGGVALALGIALLASYTSLQSQIDDHPTRNRADFDDLRTLEDRAQSYAIAGDIAVVVGLAAGGIGAYFLVRSPRRHRVAVGLLPLGHGGGVVLALPGGW